MWLTAGMALYISYIEQLCDVKYIASFGKKKNSNNNCVFASGKLRFFPLAHFEKHWKNMFLFERQTIDEFMLNLHYSILEKLV